MMDKRMRDRLRQIDLSGWNFKEWRDRFDEIIGEIIEDFVAADSGECNVWITKEGLQLFAPEVDGDGHYATIPWEQVGFQDFAAIAAMQREIKYAKEVLKEEEADRKREEEEEKKELAADDEAFLKIINEVKSMSDEAIAQKLRERYAIGEDAAKALAAHHRRCHTDET